MATPANYNKTLDIHNHASRLSRGWGKIISPEYHNDGSATLHIKPGSIGKYSWKTEHMPRLVSYTLDTSNFEHGHSGERYKNHAQPINDSNTGNSKGRVPSMSVKVTGDGKNYSVHFKKAEEIKKESTEGDINMSNPVEALVTAMMSGDTEAIYSTFNVAMNDRAMTAIDYKRQEVAQSMFTATGTSKE